MQRVEDPIETVHLYVVREDMSKPPSLLPVYLGLFFFVGIVCLARAFISIPTTRPMTYRVPAIFLPAVAFQTEQALIPTGREVIPATVAHGILSIYNGSVVSQTLPPGMIFQSREGSEVITDTAAFIPAGNAPLYGVATVPAHAVVSGVSGNIPAFRIHSIYGTSLTITNLTAFQGGKEQQVHSILTPKDRQTSLHLARTQLAAQTTRHTGLLVSCAEQATKLQMLRVTWFCTFATYQVPSGFHVTHATLAGKTVLLDGYVVIRPARIVRRG